MPRLVNDSVAVLGLGRFGRAAAESLADQGVEVLAIDRDHSIVAHVAPHVTMAVEADVTDVEALRQVGVQEYNRALVAIGTSLEASILCVSALADLGIQNIWAKATSPGHDRILKRLGANVVVFPEIDMGRRIAHEMARGHSKQMVQTIDGFAFTALEVPRDMVNRKLRERDVLAPLGITIMGVRRDGLGLPEVAHPELIPHSRDVLLVCGPTAAVDEWIH